jgi:hypothetical protein
MFTLLLEDVINSLLGILDVNEDRLVSTGSVD